MSQLPKLLFKYRSLSGEKGIQRVFEIIDKHELYFPSRAELNEPFEAVGKKLQIKNGGYAGISIAMASEEEISPLAERRDGFRILSLSEECFSPLMWGLYADSGTGICLCFRTDGSFSVAEKVQYPDEDDSYFNEKKEVEIDQIDTAVKEELFYKSHDWLYENEWRIIKKKDGLDNRFHFEGNELVAIIFGYQINETIKKMIKQFIPATVKLFKMRVAKQNRKLIVLPEDYNIPYDGRELLKQPEVIKSISELSSAIFAIEQEM